MKEIDARKLILDYDIKVNHTKYTTVVDNSGFAKGAVVFNQFTLWKIDIVPQYLNDDVIVDLYFSDENGIHIQMTLFEYLYDLKSQPLT